MSRSRRCKNVSRNCEISRNTVNTCFALLVANVLNSKLKFGHQSLLLGKLRCESTSRLLSDLSFLPVPLRSYRKRTRFDFALLKLRLKLTQLIPRFALNLQRMRCLFLGNISSQFEPSHRTLTLQWTFFAFGKFRLFGANSNFRNDFRRTARSNGSRHLYLL